MGLERKEYPVVLSEKQVVELVGEVVEVVLLAALVAVLTGETVVLEEGVVAGWFLVVVEILVIVLRCQGEKHLSRNHTEDRTSHLGVQSRGNRDIF